MGKYGQKDGGEIMRSTSFVEHINIFTYAKIFCQFCTGRALFWIAVMIFTILEPVLCSQYPRGFIFRAQIVVLAISSGLYVIQLVGVATREWDKIVMIQALSAMATTSTMPVMVDFTPLKLFIFFSSEGEYILEFACLAGGWLTIFVRPGLACLRCFRVFRLLWFYEVEVFRDSAELILSPIVGAEFVRRGFKVLKFAIRALSALGNEMFRLTNATRGGLLLMLIFFYSAFVLGSTLWIETEEKFEECLSFSSCTYTLMRLTFFDGNGFDFVYKLGTNNHEFMFYICIMFMAVTSFGILNGMVGIFGTLFAIASEEAFNSEEEEDEDEQAIRDEELELQREQEEEDNHSLGSFGGGGGGDEGGGVVGGGGMFLGGQTGKHESFVGEVDEAAQARAADRKQRILALESRKLHTKLKGKGKMSPFALAAIAELKKDNAAADADDPGGGGQQRRSFKGIVAKQMLRRNLVEVFKASPVMHEVEPDWENLNDGDDDDEMRAEGGGGLPVGGGAGGGGIAMHSSPQQKRAGGGFGGFGSMVGAVMAKDTHTAGGAGAAAAVDDNASQASHRSDHSLSQQNRGKPLPATKSSVELKKVNKAAGLMFGHRLGGKSPAGGGGGALSPPPGHKKEPKKNFHAAVGMFAKMRQEKATFAAATASAPTSNTNVGSTQRDYLGRPIQGNSSAMAQMSPSGKASQDNIKKMMKTMEMQSEMILGLFKQVQLLNQQLGILHPELHDVQEQARIEAERMLALTAGSSAPKGSYKSKAPAMLSQFSPSAAAGNNSVGGAGSDDEQGGFFSGNVSPSGGSVSPKVGKSIARGFGALMNIGQSPNAGNTATQSGAGVAMGHPTGNLAAVAPMPMSSEGGGSGSGGGGGGGWRQHQVPLSSDDSDSEHSTAPPAGGGKKLNPNSMLGRIVQGAKKEAVGGPGIRSSNSNNPNSNNHNSNNKNNNHNSNNNDDNREDHIDSDLDGRVLLGSESAKTPDVNVGKKRVGVLDMMGKIKHHPNSNASKYARTVAPASTGTDRTTQSQSEGQFLSQEQRQQQQANSSTSSPQQAGAPSGSPGTAAGALLPNQRPPVGNIVEPQDSVLSAVTGKSDLHDVQVLGADQSMSVLDIN